MNNSTNNSNNGGGGKQQPQLQLPPLPPPPQQQQQQQQQQTQLHGSGNNGGTNNSININHNNINMTCNACNRAIYDKLMSKTSPDNKIWHSDCLKCCECNKILDSRYFETSGRLYCRNHYLAYFGPSCFRCSNKITDDQYFFTIRHTTTTTTGSPNISQTDPAAMQQHQQQQHQQTNTLFFHTPCFACVWCNGTLQKGDKYCIINHQPPLPPQQLSPPPTNQSQLKNLLIGHDICAVKFCSANNNNVQAANASGSHSLQANPPVPRAKRGRAKHKPAG